VRMSVPDPRSSPFRLEPVQDDWLWLCRPPEPTPIEYADKYCSASNFSTPGRWSANVCHTLSCLVRGSAHVAFGAVQGELSPAQSLGAGTISLEELVLGCVQLVLGCVEQCCFFAKGCNLEPPPPLQHD
jgi:hypothetical protein